VRITAQLIEAEAGAHLWADRFDGSLEDVFQLQDQVATSVAGVIEPALQANEIRRAGDRATDDLTAYDLYLRALPDAESGEQDRILKALALLGKAIERDPYYGLALARAARCHNNLHVSGWTDDPEASRWEGINLARRALLAASDDPDTVARSAYALGQSGEDLEAAISLIDRSLQLNPGSARAWHFRGWMRLWAGNADLAIEHFETALRLNPRDPFPSTLMGIGVGYFFAGRFNEARAMLVRSLQQHSGWVPTYRFLAGGCAHLGRLAEARETVPRLQALTPVVVPEAAHWRDPQQRKLFLSGLRLAAGETT